MHTPLVSTDVAKDIMCVATGLGRGRGHSPYDEAGDGGTRKGVEQEGAKVPEEVALQRGEKKDTTTLLSLPYYSQYLLQTVASIEDDGRQESKEEQLWIKDQLKRQDTHKFHNHFHNVKSLRRPSKSTPP